MGQGHAHHHHHAGGNERALLGALLLTSTFLVVEVVGGVLAESLALISDAAHMFTDTAALAIALAALRIGRRPADHRRTFGYYRFEILAAALNAVLLFLVAIYILVEAWQRLRQPAEVESALMLWIAVAGLVVNLIGMRLLSGGKENSLNMKGAYLELWSDMLGSLGVIAGALVIRHTGWNWVDSVVAVGIGLWVLPRTWQLLRESLNILLEGVPEGIGVDEVERSLREVPGVQSVHDLHVWSISSGKTSLSVHVVCDDSARDGFELLRSLRELLAQRYDIHHSTVQLERVPCEQAREFHGFGPAGHADAAHAGHSH
ncbi:cation diffusion facilitator family transporter [Caldimonas tepidiphila]|uniref:cation diffusion facilitator family transporter n=1 Tax=Caldimonas tepidiphila TaxID=2315841 RepID=UPI000E5B25AB|nr:cation diffusion facilitator family transporter [Caldimonas tepidiphila]